mgnify:FL=1
MFAKKNSKMKRLMTLATLLALIVPALVTASVVVDYQINYSANNVNPNVFLAEGPNYAAANGQSLIYVKSASIATISGYSAIENNAQLLFNSTDYTSYTILLNVLELVSTTSSPTNVWINGTLPSGISLYISTTQETYSGSTLSATSTGTSSAYTLGNPISLSGNSVDYITFYITGQVTAATGTLTVQYLVQ